MNKNRINLIKIYSILSVCLFSLLFIVLIEINFNKKLLDSVEKVKAGSETIESLTLKIDQLEDDVLEKNTWKLAGTVTSSNTFSLLNIEYRELHLSITSSSSTAVFVFSIKKEALSSTEQYFRKGYSYLVASNFGRCSLKISLDSINVNDYYLNGTNIVSSTTMKIYYR